MPQVTDRNDVIFTGFTKLRFQVCSETAQRVEEQRFLSVLPAEVNDYCQNFYLFEYFKVTAIYILSCLS